MKKTNNERNNSERLKNTNEMIADLEFTEEDFILGTLEQNEILLELNENYNFTLD